MKKVVPIALCDFLDDTQDDATPLFWLDPFIADEGITFVHGKKSLGKSPLGWSWGVAVSTGVALYGLYPARRGRVLIVEADTPKRLVKPRMRLLPKPWPKDLFLHVTNPFEITTPNETRNGLVEWFKVNPMDVIIWNTLRKITTLDIKQGETAALVYSAMRTHFPQAAHVIIAHDKKDSYGFEGGSIDYGAEAFIGAQGWRDDITLSFHLTPGGSKGLLRLEMTGSQVCALEPPIMLHLDDDGTTLTLHEKTKTAKVLDALGDRVPSRDVIQDIAQKLGTGYSVATVWRVLQSLEKGRVSS